MKKEHKMKQLVMAACMCAGILPLSASADARIWLDETDLSLMIPGWGKSLAGKSIEGTPISLVSLLRSTNCIVAFAAGAVVFKERNLKRKAVALVLFFIGIALLALSR